MFRLGLFQMGVYPHLWRAQPVMIDELKVPALIAAGTLAMFVAPARVWFGQMSDSKPLFGYHRSGYVWTGAVLFVISFLAVLWQLGFSLQSGWTQTLWWAALLAMVFGAMV